MIFPLARSTTLLVIKSLKSEVCNSIIYNVDLTVKDIQTQKSNSEPNTFPYSYNRMDFNRTLLNMNPCLSVRYYNTVVVSSPAH